MTTPNEIYLDPLEAWTIKIDYANKLPSGVTIASATCVVTDQNQLNVSSTLLGDISTTVSTVTLELLAGGINGFDYKYKITATLSAGSKVDTFILHSRAK